MAHHLDLEVREQLTRDGGGRDARGGLTRAGAFEDVADVVALVFQHAREIGMTGPRPRDGRAFRARRVLGRLGADVHGVLPVVPVLVADEEGDRAAERLAFAHAGEDLGAIRLDHHASSASVSTLTAPQIRGDGIGIDREAGGKSFEYRDERLAMRLACGQKTQHRLVILHELSATFWRRASCARWRGCRSRPVFAGSNSHPPAVAEPVRTCSCTSGGDSCQEARGEEEGGEEARGGNHEMTLGGMTLVADRFIRFDDGTVRDLATGELVTLVEITMTDAAEQVARRDRCLAMLDAHGAMDGAMRRGR